MDANNNHWVITFTSEGPQIEVYRQPNDAPAKKRITKLECPSAREMAAPEWDSGYIMDMVESLPRGHVPMLVKSKTHSTNDLAAGLTNKQLVILFESLLDVPLSSQYTNIKAFARLISRVSGHSEGSVRTCINGGIDYDKSSVKNDVEVVASLLDTVKPKLAQMLRNNVE